MHSHPSQTRQHQAKERHLHSLKPCAAFQKFKSISSARLSDSERRIVPAGSLSTEPKVAGGGKSGWVWGCWDWIRWACDWWTLCGFWGTIVSRSGPVSMGLGLDKCLQANGWARSRSSLRAAKSNIRFHKPLAPDVAAYNTVLLREQGNHIQQRQPPNSTQASSSELGRDGPTNGDGFDVGVDEALVRLDSRYSSKWSARRMYARIGTLDALSSRRHAFVRRAPDNRHVRWPQG